MIRAGRAEIVLLDLMLPGVDGFDLCRDIRSESSVGIIVVSARRGEQDKVRALNLGADDYLTKPFGVDELLARITALLRRSRAAPPPAAVGPLTFGNVTIDLDAQLVVKSGRARPPHADRVRVAPRAGSGGGAAAPPRRAPAQGLGSGL